MKRSVAWALVVSVVLLQAVGAAPAPDPVAAQSCRVVGIQVVGDVGIDPDDEDWEMMPFGEEMGTSVVLAVISSRWDIVPLEAMVAKLRSFRDGQGNDLAPVQYDSDTIDAAESLWKLMPLGSSPRGGVRLVTADGRRVPSPDSHVVRAEGSIDTLVGLKPQSARQDGVALETGTKITAGPLTFEVLAVEFPGAHEAAKEEGKAIRRAVVATDLNHLVGDVDWALGIDEPSILYEDDSPSAGGRPRHGKEAMTIMLETPDAVDRIAFIQVFDGQGKEVEWRFHGWEPTEGTADEETAQTTTRLMIGLPKKLDKVDVVVHYYEEVRKVEVPFSVETGLAVESIATP
jgi:hypothetical protein